MARPPKKGADEGRAKRRTKVVDLAEFRKTVTGSMPNVSEGFRDPKVWIDTGNYTLNKLISNDFGKGVPLGKISMFAGESGAGKSYITSGNLVRNAQKEGCFVILIDSENALDEGWLEPLGVDTSEDALMKLNAAQIDDIAGIISRYIERYRAVNDDLPEEDRQRVLIVVDGLGMLVTPTESEQFDKGDMKGDMGRKAKQLKSLVANVTNRIAPYDIGVVMTNHVYDSQDMFDPEKKITGGHGIVFASSIVAVIGHSKLKEDSEGNKTSDVSGIKAMCRVRKTRYAKPFEGVTIKIPYDTGMNPYSGMVEYFEKRGILGKSGNKLVYLALDGTEVKLFRKQFEKNHEGILDLMMEESESLPDDAPAPAEADGAEDSGAMVEDGGE